MSSYPDLDLFGEKATRRDWQQGWAPSGAPARDDLFAFFLKHAFNESDKGVVAR